jgi:DinB family protein
VSEDPLSPPVDDKDWTWVLERPCPECGFDASTVTDVPARTRAAVEAIRAALTRPGAAERPSPHVWSPLEYACHARDVCIVFGARLAAMRGTTDPLFVNWDQDETAQAERYWEQDPAQVSRELAEEGERIAADFAGVGPDEWSRPGRRSNGSAFTVETLSRYFLHDLEHHAHDVAPR